jgi:hypothetical protein
MQTIPSKNKMKFILRTMLLTATACTVTRIYGQEDNNSQPLVEAVGLWRDLVELNQRREHNGSENFHIERMWLNLMDILRAWRNIYPEVGKSCKI